MTSANDIAAKSAGVGGVVGAIVGYLSSLYHKWRGDKRVDIIVGKVERLQKELDTHQLNVAENYLNKSEIFAILREMKSDMQIVNNKLDTLIAQLADIRVADARRDLRRD